MWSLAGWRRQRLLQRINLPARGWQRTLSDLPVLSGLDADERRRLAELAWLFLHEKAIVGVQGLEVTEVMRLRIAALACLPLLALDIDYYREFQTVLVYPGGFVARHEYQDEAGVVHEVVAELSGEAWERGPVILSAEDVMAACACDGTNLVIHEFVHKLDMLNGDANGLPPLHPEMRVADWARAFEVAYADMSDRVNRGEETAIDPYAAESPAECLAVFSEAFFETPAVLLACYPDIYQQLRLFYRQDPLRRLGA
ncbi:zinc-dependent peptidase [Marinobacterium aestuariivivens]|uniref:Zinc-dependent peptidase n=1 Tax=Marinobacterium aestuariivivens TaxID=1698799 RepID=A0ABW2A5C9_9GAMM